MYINIRVVLCRLAESEDEIVVRVFDADTIIMDEMFLWISILLFKVHVKYINGFFIHLLHSLFVFVLSNCSFHIATHGWRPYQTPAVRLRQFRTYPRIDKDGSKLFATYYCHQIQYMVNPVRNYK